MSEAVVVQVTKNAVGEYVVPTANPSVPVLTIDRLVRLASGARGPGKLLVTLVVDADARPAKG